MIQKNNKKKNEEKGDTMDVHSLSENRTQLSRVYKFTMTGACTNRKRYNVSS